MNANKCEWCDKLVKGNIVWYIPEKNKYISACEKCASKNIEEIPPIHPHVIAGHLK
jgi:hypothetical protein